LIVADRAPALDLEPGRAKRSANRQKRDRFSDFLRAASAQVVCARGRHDAVRAIDVTSGLRGGVVLD
jgi:hypothetical protein